MEKIKNLLFEIGVEELPLKAAINLANELAIIMGQLLRQHNFNFSEAKAFTTPRRLTVFVENLNFMQSAQVLEKRGPAYTRAFDLDGNPTPAALGFARSCGVEITDLGELKNSEGHWLIHRETKPGQTLDSLIEQIIKHAIDKLAIPRPMSWGDSTVKFVRPVHWIVLLYGNEVLDAEILGLQSDRVTYGHRVHHPEKIILENSDEYLTKLKSAYVIADFNERQEIISNQIKKIADEYNSEPVVDLDLLNQVTALVEWPVVLSGSFEEKFLALPSECLICSMQQHQKYFALLNKNNKKLLPHFIFVANLASKNSKQVINGNQRVLRARLNDAKFFYEKDRSESLISRLGKLANIIFHHKLGSLADKTERNIRLSAKLAELLHCNSEIAERAASLAKCDLVTNMVGEFPELQGIMGSYYALADGENPLVSKILQQYYYPRRAQDILPDSLEACCVALADRLDTLVGLFSIGERSLGDKDPFGMRRMALGILRIIIEKKLPLDLLNLLELAYQNYKNNKLLNNSNSELFNFCMERLKFYYTEQNVSKNIFSAVLDKKINQPYDFAMRVQAMTNFVNLSQAESLIKAHKRVNNILSKEAWMDYTQEINKNLLTNPAEIKLTTELEKYSEIIDFLIKNKNYTDALKELAELQPVVDDFFDKVMVIVEDILVKQNRLLLLAKLKQLLESVANLEVLAAGG